MVPACQQPGSYASSSPRTAYLPYVASVLHVVLYLVSSQWHKRQLKEDDSERKVSNCTYLIITVHTLQVVAVIARCHLLHLTHRWVSLGKSSALQSTLLYNAI